jgi:hypothetical protein
MMGDHIRTPQALKGWKSEIKRNDQLLIHQSLQQQDLLDSDGDGRNEGSAEFA